MGSGITMSQRLITSFSDGDAIAFNACEEIEGDYCRFLQKSLNKPVLLAGPVTTPKPQSSEDESGWGVWLDKFAPKAVIFCAFGSEVVLEKDQFEQLGVGSAATDTQTPSGRVFRHALRVRVDVGGVDVVPLPGPLGDQGVQARLLSGVLKVGVEVVKGDEDGLFTKEGVHEAIMAAMTKETQIAKQIRENHDRLKGLLLSEGFLNSYFDTFVHNLQTLLP
ncbi:hypothetical protein ACS0TY_032180 [Phlomoides rotata]